MRLIDADALKKAICIDEPISIGETWEQLYDAVVKAIDNAPTIDTDCIHCDSGYAQGYSDGYLKGKEERPTGKWNKCFNKEYFIGWKCSRCEKICNGIFNYCPNCGARMEADNEVN